MFSQYFKDLFQQLQFVLIVVARFVKILFRLKKQIEMLHLDYDTQHIFHNSFVVLRYRFRNALWYRFDKHSTIEKEVKVFNVENFGNEFDLIVYGFFQRVVYKIKVIPRFTLRSDDFKIVISNIGIGLGEREIPEFHFGTTEILICSADVKAHNLKLINYTIDLKTNSFNKNQFI